MMFVSSQLTSFSKLRGQSSFALGADMTTGGPPNPLLFASELRMFFLCHESTLFTPAWASFFDGPDGSFLP